MDRQTLYVLESILVHPLRHERPTHDELSFAIAEALRVITAELDKPAPDFTEALPPPASAAPLMALPSWFVGHYKMPFSVWTAPDQKQYETTSLNYAYQKAKTLANNLNVPAYIYDRRQLVQVVYPHDPTHEPGGLTPLSAKGNFND